MLNQDFNRQHHKLYMSFVSAETVPNQRMCEDLVWHTGTLMFISHWNDVTNQIWMTQCDDLHQLKLF